MVKFFRKEEKRMGKFVVQKKIALSGNVGCQIYVLGQKSYIVQ